MQYYKTISVFSDHTEVKYWKTNNPNKLLRLADFIICLGTHKPNTKGDTIWTA